MFGFQRIAAAVPKLKVADVNYNKTEIMSLIEQAEENSATIIVFPEMAVCGYTCADLFHQSTLIESAHKAIIEIAKKSPEVDVLYSAQISTTTKEQVQSLIKNIPNLISDIITPFR